MFLSLVSAAAAASVTVTVTDQLQVPIAGIKVYAFTEAGAYYGINATTDQDGVAAMAEESNYAPGSYQFRIDYLGHQFWTDSVSLPDTPQISHAIEHVLVDVAVVSAGTPGARVRVYLFNAAGSYLGQNQTTDATSHVQFTLPADAGFKFRADILGYPYWSEAVDVVTGPSMAVTIDAGGGLLRVTVQENASTPMPGVKVYLFSHDGKYLGHNATTDANAQVSFDVPTGTFKVRADYLGYQFWSNDITVATNTDIDLEIFHQDISVAVNGVYQTSQPIAGAKVYLFTAQGTYVGQNMITDAAGQCVFHLPAMDYKVRVDYFSHQYWSDAFNFTDIDVDIPMSEARVSVTWDIFSLDDVPVYVFTADDSYAGLNATTDDAGQAVFRLPAGTWKFRANYLVDHYWSAPTDLTASELVPITIFTGGGTFELDILKDDGTPVEGVNCHVYSDTNQYTGLKGVTNSQGIVSFNLPNGQFRIRYDYLGHQFWSEDYDVSSSWNDTIIIPHRNITVTVNQFFDAPQPVEGAKVYLFTGSDAYLNINQVTGADGQVVFSLPDRDFKVRADYLLTQYWSPVFNGTNATVEIPMAEAGVRVTGAGHPLGEVIVHAFTDNDQYMGISVDTDASGYALFRLPEGTYKFKADYQSGQFWTSPQALSAGMHHEIELATGGGLFGFTVLKSAGEPLAGVKCYVFRQPDDVYVGVSGVTDQNGQVFLDVVDGTYRIRVDYLGYRLFSDAYDVSQSLNEVFTIAHQDVQITVNGVMQSPEPLENVKVYLFKPDGTYLNHNQMTDADGRITLSLPSQDFQLRADYLGVKHWSQVFNAQNVDFNLPLGEAQITVTGAGQALEGVKVYAFGAAGTYTGLNAATDANGQVMFRLPIQAYTFRADFMGGEFFSTPMTLFAGQTEPVSIDTGGGTYSLTVLQGQGTPLASVKCYVFTQADAYIGVSGTTNAEGVTSFYLPGGSYKFRIDYLGHKYWTDVATVPTQLETIYSIPHHRTDVHVLGLNPGPQPLVGVRVYLFSAAGQYMGQNLTTDENGTVSFMLPEQAYLARADTNGQQYWSAPLAVGSNIIAVNAGTDEILPAIADFEAAVTGSGTVQLSWTPYDAQTTPTPQGYLIYRRHNSQASFQPVTADLLGPAAATYTDSGAVLSGNYFYYIAGQDTNGVIGYPGAIKAVTVVADIPDNATPVTGVGASWEQNKARLAWDPLDGYRFQIYRGVSSTEIAELAQADAAPYYDDSADSYLTWYYQIASIREYPNPATGETIQRIGPRSSVFVLAGQPAPGITIPDAQANPDNTYTIVSGASDEYVFEGTYTNLSGDVTVTATLGDQTVTGSGSNGTFSITLPDAGSWQITISETSGWQSIVIDATIDVDDQPPALTVNGSTQRTTTDDTITIEGTTVDMGSGVAGVEVRSDRYAGQPFGTVLEGTGAFSCQVPLKVGDNQLTVVAEDAVGNESQSVVTVTQQITALPVVTIGQPANGASVSQERIDISGSMRSSLDPDQIRMVCQDQVRFPTGSRGDYTFAFDNVQLVQGPNTLTVTAETTHGNVSASIIVIYETQANDSEPEPPVVTLNVPQSVIYMAGSTHTVSGSVSSSAGIASVLVNAQAVELTGPATSATFGHTIDLAGVGTLTITVVATDVNGLSTTGSYQIIHDNVPPAISLSGTTLEPPPQINTVIASPFPIEGTVTDANLAGVSINDQNIGVAPGSASGQWRFSARMALTRGEETRLEIQAWDQTGAQSSAEYLLRLDASLEIQVLSPVADAELEAEGASYALPVSLRVPGIAADDQIRISVDGGTAQLLTHADEAASGTIAMSADAGAHTLDVVVSDAGGTQLASTTSSFTVVNLANVPLTLESQEPANNATDIEPNTFIAFYFNKPLDPALLSIEVRETAHGKVYAEAQPGADITQQSHIQLTEVHRDNENVPGGISIFPEDTMAAFYPQRDFAYDGTVYVTVVYDGAELGRSNFRIRSLPTLVHGFVTDQFGQPVEGISVTIRDLDRTAVTNKDGNFGFGFGEPASAMLPGGRYRAVANANRENSAFGSTEFWLTVNAGRLHDNGLVKIPFLNPDEPFRLAGGQQSQVILASGELELDLGQAALSFPDGRRQGAVHAQFMKIQESAYSPLHAAYPSWVFSLQPAGIAVDGQVDVTFSVPPLSDSLDYVEFFGERVILVALDPNVLEIVPVGVGLVDKELKQVRSEKPIAIERLDILGYALTTEANQALLKQFANDEITLPQLIGQLQAQQ